MTLNHVQPLHPTQFSFRTILKPSEGIFKEKGSKFLAFAYPVKTEEDIKAVLDTLRKKYFDARHHCYAWMLGADKTRFRAYDDGEPNHSAGDPILGQIRSSELTNVLIVVVRYFGGVKLGVSGLISAYRAAAADALTNASIVTEEVKQFFDLTYDYSFSPEVMRLVKDFELTIVDQFFTEKGFLKVAVRLAVRDKFIEKIELLRAMKMEIDLTEYQ